MGLTGSGSAKHMLLGGLVVCEPGTCVASLLGSEWFCVGAVSEFVKLWKRGSCSK